MPLIDNDALNALSRLSIEIRNTKDAFSLACRLRPDLAARAWRGMDGKELAAAGGKKAPNAPVDDTDTDTDDDDLDVPPVERGQPSEPDTDEDDDASEGVPQPTKPAAEPSKKGNSDCDCDSDDCDCDQQKEKVTDDDSADD